MEVRKGANGEYEALEVEVYSRVGTEGIPYFDLTAPLTAVLRVKREDGTTSEYALEVVEQAEVAGGSKLRVRYEPTAEDFPIVGVLRGYVQVTLDAGGGRQSQPFPIAVVGRF